MTTRSRSCKRRGHDQAELMPLILGLMPISAKNGVIETERGKECLTFPGPGGYKIEWPPGTVRIPLEKAMSHHLMASCCNYDRAPKQTGGVEAPPPHRYSSRRRRPVGMRSTCSERNLNSDARDQCLPERAMPK